MTKQAQTTRTCSSCGQKKPLFAFLELSLKGHTYGDICATCRGSGLGRKKAPELEVAERSGGTTGHQIDSKKWLKEAAEKQDKQKLTAERHHEEKMKKENTQEDKSEKKQEREQNERRHREEYIQQQAPAKKSSDKDKAQQEGQKQQTQGFYERKTQTNKDANAKASSEEFGKKIDNISPDYVDKYVSRTGRSAESLFGRQIGDFMRGKRNQGNNLGKAIDNFQQKTEAKPGFLSNTVKEQGDKQIQQEKETMAAEFVKNNFKKF